MNVEKTLEGLGYVLPTPPARLGVYAPCKLFGDGKLAYLSGCGPHIGEKKYLGKVGQDLTLEEGCKAAENCALNLLALLKREIGDLDKIKCIVKATAFVASAEGFYSQPQVANAASELFVKALGEEKGCAARSAVGVNALPGNMAVEIELLVELE